MTAVSTTAPPAGWSFSSTLQQARTPIGLILVATAGVGVFVGAHWQPMILVMLPLYFVTVLAPALARRGETWFLTAAIWVVAVIVRRNNMEDHVYLYLAWLVAIAVSLLDPATFVEEAKRQGRFLLAMVFGFATAWKVASTSFLSGTALWTVGLLDDRMEPVLQLMGISPDSLDAARPQVAEVAHGERSSFPIELSGYSSTALVLLALGTIAIEATIAIAYAAPDTSRLARVRAPALVVFGVVTYAFVPVLPFALLLAVIGSAVADFDRRTVAAFGFMVLVTIIRFATL